MIHVHMYIIFYSRYAHNTKASICLGGLVGTVLVRWSIPLSHLHVSIARIHITTLTLLGTDRLTGGRVSNILHGCQAVGSETFTDPSGQTLDLPGLLEPPREAITIPSPLPFSPPLALFPGEPFEAEVDSEHESLLPVLFLSELLHCTWE